MEVKTPDMTTIFGIEIASILWAVGTIIIICTIWGILYRMLIYPHWRVWAAHKDGMADLQRAKNEQQIQVAQAQARLDAAQLNKQAAIIEAEAVSEQISRIGTQLEHHDLYLRWQWIKMMDEQETKTTVIYVPTEANLPILEASRLKQR